MSNLRLYSIAECRAYDEAAVEQANENYEAALTILNTMTLQNCTAKQKVLRELKIAEINLLKLQCQDPSITQILEDRVQSVDPVSKMYISLIKAGAHSCRGNILDSAKFLEEAMVAFPGNINVYDAERNTYFRNLALSKHGAKFDSLLKSKANDDPALARVVSEAKAKLKTGELSYVVLDFSADWCAGCEGMDELLEHQAVREFLQKRKIQIISVDVGKFDKNLSLINYYRVRAITKLAGISSKNDRIKLGLFQPLVLEKNKEVLNISGFKALINNLP